MKPVSWILSMLAAVLAMIAASPAIAPAALLAQWHFDQSAGVIVHDGTGIYDGILSPTGSSFTSGGISGNALSLDRAAVGYASMGNVLGFASGDFSIVAWVNTTTTQNDTTYLGKHESGSENGYFYSINATGGGGQADKATFVASEFVAMGVTSTTSVNDGTWHQIVGVYAAGGDERIYVDAAPVEATDLSEPIVTNSAPFLIGAVNQSGLPNARYTGLIDEVEIYDQALSPSQVKILFQHPTQVVPEPQSASLVALFSLLCLMRLRRRAAG